MTTLQAILLYLAVGYFVDRALMELDGSWLTLDEDYVVGLRYLHQFMWPVVIFAICYLTICGLLYVSTRACWAVLRPTTRSSTGGR